MSDPVFRMKTYVPQRMSVCLFDGPLLLFLSVFIVACAGELISARLVIHSDVHSLVYVHVFVCRRVWSPCTTFLMPSGHLTTAKMVRQSNTVELALLFVFWLFAHQ